MNLSFTTRLSLRQLAIPLCLVSAVGLSGCFNGSGGSSRTDLRPTVPELPAEVLRPIVFVHGTAGSASQYYSQAMRFDSNGYSADYVSAFEYSTNGLPAILAARDGALNDVLDAHIDRVLAEHNADTVNIACHSLGASVCAQYLSDQQRAAKVNAYVALDGGGGTGPDTTCPGEEGWRAPCLGIFVNPERTIGSNNVYLTEETHVQAATSAASFAAQFEFFTGQEPATTDIVVEEGEVAISGRAVYFPANEGADGSTLRIWEIDSDTGERLAGEPLESFAIDASGEWGPVDLETGAHYEFELQRPGRATHHFYRQPFLRASDLVRFNTSAAGSDIETNTNSGPDHAALVISRDLEWYVDNGEQTDILEISTVSPLQGDEPPFDLITSEMGNGNIGIHVHDDEATPRETTGELLEYFHAQIFQTGADVFMPANTDPDGYISIVSSPRGDTERKQQLNVPNWASSEHRISLTFNDFVQD
ncbi:Alpha/beta hydrolase family protein [Pseudomonas saudimassiliensis]|uniref:Alpha/beta hydrolase family protein n=1 Tax=Pseudomonas saudimassiliensis TaxID=1461581 RepID=A0A078ME77_9PSED|nr:alpha/beta fold hydrolase [Pseudomonas saudimassiliensis]CEA04555.1 Alpha/beta hydrolase family protein [Pseudomonas saudimassiliensis]CEF26683.1 Alpha/beta hydrolase family protein [Pseudomonas saudimassiliensis]